MKNKQHFINDVFTGNTKEKTVVKRASLLLAIALTGGAMGCSWVDVTDEGKSVNIYTQAQVEGCEKLGQSNTKVLDKVTFVKRSLEKQGEELANLARNEAANMGGNAIVKMGEIEDGHQTFGVYRCR